MKNFLILYRDIDWGSVGTGAATGAGTGTVFGPWGTVIGGVIGGASALIGGGQKKKANALFGSNPYPTQSVPQAELDNQEMARQGANEGLPSQQYAEAMKNIQRQQTTALRMANDRRVGAGLVPAINQQATDAQAKLDIANANARLANKRTLYGVNNNVARYQQAAFDWNSKNRYNQNYNYAMQLQGAGNQNIMHGIDTAAAALLRYGGKGLFGKKSVYDPSGGDPSYYGSDPLVGPQSYDPSLIPGNS